MGFRRDLNEVLGWKLNWEAVPYVGEDGIKECTVWQLDFDLWWINFTGECECPPSFASCSKHGVRHAGGHCSLLRPRGGSGWIGTVWVASPPASGLSWDPGQREPCQAVLPARVHGGWLAWGHDGGAWGEWDSGVCVWATVPPAAPLLGVRVVFKSLLRAWLTGTIQPIKSN